MNKLLPSGFLLGVVFASAVMRLCCCPTLWVDEELSLYTTNKVGDTVLTYGDDNRYVARFYAFVDETSCDSCIHDIARLARTLSERKDVQIVLFMQVRDEIAIERFREKYRWHLPIVNDVATAYKQLYHIVRSPVCLLTDRTGVITLIDIPGKLTWSKQAFEQTLTEISNKSESLGENLTRVQQWVIRSADNTQVRNWITQFGTPVQGKDEFILWNFFSKELLWIDGRGNILRRMALTEFPENHGSTIPRPIFFAGEAAPNSIPFLNLNFVDITATMYKVFFDTNTLERLWDIPPPDSLHSPATTAFRLSDTSFLVASMYSDRVALRQNPGIYTARIVNSAGKTLRTLGMYEEYNQSLYIMNYFMQSFCRDDDGNIYMAESFADTIRVYNQAGNLLHSIACEYDSTLWYYQWREDFMALDEDSPVEELMQPSDRITKVAGVNGLFYDSSEKNVYVVYQRKVATPAGNTSYRFFLHRPGRESKRIRRDLALPGDAKPIHIKQGLLYCTETVDGILNLTVYAIPDWL